MTSRGPRRHPRGMSSADHAVPGLGRSHRTADLGPSPTVGAHRRAAHPDRVRTTRRWTVGVLAAATSALAAYLVLVVAAVWVVVSTVDAVAARDTPPLDLVAVLADVAPGLLVGWCTGLAASAALAGGEALGARVAGVAAGAVGMTAGAAVLAVTGIL